MSHSLNYYALVGGAWYSSCVLCLCVITSMAHLQNSIIRTLKILNQSFYVQIAFACVNKTSKLGTMCIFYVSFIRC